MDKANQMGYSIIRICGYMLFDYKNGWKNYKARWTSPEAGQNKYETN